MPIIVFDLDHTICLPNLEHIDLAKRYEKAKPIVATILLMQTLYRKSNQIIIHTSRGMLTYDGNVKMIELYHRNLTEKWLKKHDVPYDKLVFGKPYGHYYYDDNKNISLDELKKLCK